MIEDFKFIIQDKYKYWENDSSPASPLKLNDREASMEVCISQIPDNVLVICIPAGGKAHSGMIGSEAGFKCSCDYFILSTQGEKTDVYFVEMKKTINKDYREAKKAYKQIIFTIPIFEYLVKMVEVHCPTSPMIDKHFVVIAEKSSDGLNKQSIRSKSSEEKLFQNENFKIIYSKFIPFDQLKL